MPLHDDKVESAESTRTLSRRSVVKGAAWSVPVIAAASAMAPSAAAASTDDLTVTGICTTGTVDPANRRRFRVRANRAITASSTFTLTSSGALNNVANESTTGTVVVSGPSAPAPVTGTISYTVSLTAAQAAGTSFDVVITIQGTAAPGTVRSLRLVYNGTDQSPLDNVSSFTVTVTQTGTGQNATLSQLCTPPLPV